MNVADATREAVSHFPYRKKGLVGFFKNWVHPIRGLRSTWELESSLKVEIAAVPVAIGLGKAFKLSSGRRLLLVGLVFQVILVELLNTGIEELVRDNHPKRSPHYRRAMDASAAAVLISVGVAAIGAAYIIWDGVRSRYAAMDYLDLVMMRDKLETYLDRIDQQTKPSRLILSVRKAVYMARVALIDATIKAKKK